MNPVIQGILDRNPWPAPNQAPDENGNNLQATTLFDNRVDSLIAKLDQHVGPVDLLTVRYFLGDSDQSFPLGLLGGGFLPGYNTDTPTNVQLLSGSFTHLLSTKLLLEVRGGYNRFDETFFPEDHDFDPNSIGLATVSEPAGFRPAADPRVGLRERRRQPVAAARPRRQQLSGVRESLLQRGPAQLERRVRVSPHDRGRVLRCRLSRPSRLRQPRGFRRRTAGGRPAGQGRLAAVHLSEQPRLLPSGLLSGAPQRHAQLGRAMGLLRRHRRRRRSLQRLRYGRRSR